MENLYEENTENDIVKWYYDHILGLAPALHRTRRQLWFSSRVARLGASGTICTSDISKADSVFSYFRPCALVRCGTGGGAWVLIYIKLRDKGKYTARMDYSPPLRMIVLQK